MRYPRVLVAGLRGGSGKTLVTLGLVAAWRRNGKAVAPFKKGPDYIDAAWLSAAAGQPCRNMDMYLMPRQGILTSLVEAAQHSDVAVVEGNRGLFDGMDAEGSFSSAQLAKLLSAPVVIVVDCTKSTRTVAAMIYGCIQLDPSVSIGGVVLNHVAGGRHESVVRNAVEQLCAIPILGVVPRIRTEIFPERHLGLVPPQEHDARQEAIQRVSEVGEKYLDLHEFWRLARQAPDIDTAPDEIAAKEGGSEESVCIGVFRDAAFQFYYPENLESLVKEGAKIVEISPLADNRLPSVDGLYIGGGFPETLAPALARNRQFIDSARDRIVNGLPVYAECGGAVYLGEMLVFGSNTYPMVGVLPVTFGFKPEPQGHGYVELETVGANPFYALGDYLRGHEFHYTYLESANEDELAFAFKVRRGVGFGDGHDGICRFNVLASYTHVHALGTKSWARAVVRAAVRFKNKEPLT